MKLSLCLFIFVPILYCFVCFQASAQVWDGHVCTRKVLKYYRQYYCSCHRLWWCCGNSHRNVGYYGQENICCYGWTHNGDKNCSIPVCVPECQNGGECVHPFTCECAAGYDGDICEGTASCSHLDPCYPGRCLGNTTTNSTDSDITTTVTSVTSVTEDYSNSTNTSQCLCIEGFGGPSCLLFVNEYTPVIEKCNASFSNRNNAKNTLISRHQVDATDKTGVDVTWTNDPEFNVIECYLHATFDADYTFGLLPKIPDYIRNTSFGVVEGHFEITHTKIDHEGIRRVVNEEKLTCSEPSKDVPLHDLKCHIKQSNIISLSSGDVYTLKFKATSGGYRELLNTDTDNVTGVNYYIGPTAQNSVEFRFDYDEPIHCYVNGTRDSSTGCSYDTAMTLEKDITKDAISPEWDGWSDNLSGVLRYVFEVWKLEYSVDEKGLKEPEIKTEFNPKPLYITEAMADNLTFPKYKPSEPGAYSCILEINDRANNSEYVRRIVIFDDVTKISTSTSDILFVSSAAEETDYTWQTTYFEDNITSVMVNWTGHFFNTVHKDGRFLEKVLKYEARLSDPNNPKRHDYKRIIPAFDDHEGSRTIERINHINSIVKYEVVYETVTRKRTAPSVSNWKTVTPLQEDYTFPLAKHTVTDGYGVQVWVKAYDIMNHTKVDTTVVRFDKTPPVLYSPILKFNVNDGPYPLTSRLTIRSKDGHSGLKKISLQFVRNSTGEVRRPINDVAVLKQSESECPKDTNPDCYCIQDDCFTEKLQIDINNCHLTVPVDIISSETYSLHLTTYNRAMLSTSSTTELGSVLQFTGIQQYPSPANITVVTKTHNTITIRWTLIPTCYERFRNVVLLKKPDNSTKEFNVEKEETEFTIPDLEPSAKYEIEMYSEYGNESHSVQSVAVSYIAPSTNSAAFVFPQYGFYAIGGGFFLILATVIIVFIILGRMGKLQKVKRRVSKRVSYWRNTMYNKRQKDRQPRQSRNNRAVSKYYDNDVQFYGGMEFEGEQHWHIRRRNISLEEEIARGKFAIIFKAKLYSSKNIEELVVAKALHEDYTEVQKIEMKAKIHFYATKVGHHVNVVEFKGSVEDDARGDMMVLEYCKNGTLKQYLETVRHCFDSDVSDKLARMAYGICLGMDYLASKEIVHRRLAARNVLLNHLFEAKIAGFGPNPEEIGTNVNSVQANVPVKWVAPECIKNQDNATELSDAWSFGIVLWEIFSLGETPYPGIDSNEIYRYLTEGERMKKPEYCDVIFYRIMKKCWQYEPNRRDGFTTLKDQLRPLFHQGEGDDIYMQLIKE